MYNFLLLLPLRTPSYYYYLYVQLLTSTYNFLPLLPLRTYYLYVQLLTFTYNFLPLLPLPITSTTTSTYVFKQILNPELDCASLGSYLHILKTTKCDNYYYVYNYVHYY